MWYFLNYLRTSLNLSFNPDVIRVDIERRAHKEIEIVFQE